MEIVKQNGRFTLFSCKFHSNIYSILFGYKCVNESIVLKNLSTDKPTKLIWTEYIHFVHSQHETQDECI